MLTTWTASESIPNPLQNGKRFLFIPHIIIICYQYIHFQNKFSVFIKIIQIKSFYLRNISKFSKKNKFAGKIIEVDKPLPEDLK